MLTNKRSVAGWAITALATVGLVGAAPGASADAVAEEPVAVDLAERPVAIANPDVPLDVIASLPEVVQLSDVTIDESYQIGMPIVYPDGTLVEGQDPEVTRAVRNSRALCSGSALAPGTGSFGPASTCGSVVFGSPGYYRGYVWNTGGVGINTPRACGQGRGFTSQAVPTWYSVSCGTNTGGSVHWGNVLGNPAFRAQSLSVPLSISVRWSS